jgi:hypothetical protein
VNGGNASTIMNQTFITKQILEGLDKFGAIAATFFTSYWVFFEGLYVFSPFIILSISITVAYHAVYIDSNKKTFRNYICLFGLKLGKAEPLPNIKYILVKDTVFSTSIFRGMGKTYHNNYEVALVCEGKIIISLLYSIDKKEVIDLVRQISKELKCQIEDLTKEKLLSINIYNTHV